MGSPHNTTPLSVCSSVKFNSVDKMKLVTLTYLFVTLAYVQGQCEPDDGHFPEGCLADPFRAKLNCQEETCQCQIYGQEFADSCPDFIPDETLGGLNASLLTGEKCQDICDSIAADESKCKYFRWETKPNNAFDCTLMDTTQCTVYQACDDDNCQSGQAGCSNGDKPTPPHPGAESCNAKVEFLREAEAVHWTCINPFDIKQEHINIYGNESIATGTFCWTVRRCATFDKEGNDTTNEFYKRLVVQCNNASLTDGRWVSYPQMSDNDISDAVDGDEAGNILLDQTCSDIPADLELDATELHKPGVSFICTEQDDEHLVFTDDQVVIKQDNICMVLCNLHHVMTIEPKFDFNNGVTKFWKYTAGEDGKGEEATSENVYCFEY